MYIHGDQTVAVPKNLSFSKFMLDKLRAVKDDEICLENGLTGETLTYKEATQYAVNLSVALSKLGVQRGHVVAIGCQPFLHFIPTTLAVSFTGATYTIYDEAERTTNLKHRLELAMPKYLICTSMFWKNHKELIKSFDCIKTYIAVDDVPDLEISLTSLVSITENVKVETFEPAPVQILTDTVQITYSSGTTNTPKAIKRSHYNELCSVLLRSYETITPLKTAMIIRSWSIRVYTIVTLKFMTLGRKIVFAYNLPMATTLQILRDCKVDIIFLLPFHVREMANNSLPTDNYFDTLKVINCAGTPLKAEMHQEFHKRFPKVHICQCYGSSECDETTRYLFDDISKLGSIGRAGSGKIIKIVDPTTRALLGPNQVGEICVKSPTVTQGFVNINLDDYMDEEKFFKTGDLGYYDEDNYFFYVDRISNFICWKDNKVSPAELENVLLQHPAVLDVAVIGKPVSGVGEVPMALVEKKPGANVAEEELIEFVASQVSPQMELRGGVMFISKLPRPDGGKVLRHELKEIIKKNMLST